LVRWKKRSASRSPVLLRAIIRAQKETLTELVLDIEVKAIKDEVFFTLIGDIKVVEWSGLISPTLGVRAKCTPDEVGKILSLRGA